MRRRLAAQAVYRGVAARQPPGSSLCATSMRTLRSAIPHSCSSWFFSASLPFLHVPFFYKIKPGGGGLAFLLALVRLQRRSGTIRRALCSPLLSSPLLSPLLSSLLPFLLSLSPSAGHCLGFPFCSLLASPLLSPPPSSSYVGIASRLKQFPRPHIAFVCPHGWDQRCPMVVGGFAVAVGRVRRDAQLSDRGCLSAFI